MAAFKRGYQKLFTTSWAIVRHKHKFNTKKPWMHFDRKLMEHLTVPLMPKMERLPRSETCKQQQGRLSEEENLYEQFLVQQFNKVLETSQMLVVLQPLSMSAEDRKVIHNKLFKKGIKLALHSNTVVRKSIADTKWQNMEPLLTGHTLLAYSNEPKVKDLVKIMRQTQQAYILAGFVEDQLLSKEGIVKYAKLPNIETMRGELVSILNSSASKTRSLLSSHQQTLSTNLAQYIKQETEAATDTTDK